MRLLFHIFNQAAITERSDNELLIEILDHLDAMVGY